MPANRFNGYTGYGVGLRVPHYDHILSKKPTVVTNFSARARSNGVSDLRKRRAWIDSNPARFNLHSQLAPQVLEIDAHRTVLPFVVQVAQHRCARGLIAQP
jgi:hypothetical protein